MEAARRKEYLDALGVETWVRRELSVVPAKAGTQEAVPSDWAGLRAMVKDCRLCRLCETRTQTVFGVGPERAPLMVVGEGPGADEDAQGEPFVGRAGKLLDEMLKAIGHSRKTNTFIANVVKCLRYTALVQLGDGSWERIGRLVASKYSGEVRSVDAEGRIVRRRVTGWHASPLGNRRVFKLSYASAKAAGASKSGVQLTGDHPVMTERGWVAVQELRKGDRIATGHGLSALAFDTVCGTLLGDGHLSRTKSDLCFTHSEKQGDYAKFKARALAELAPVCETYNVAAVVSGPRAYPVVRVRVPAHRSLGFLRSQFYGEKKRVPAWIASRLTPRMLAFWFMDDGYLRVREDRRPCAEIATCAFSPADIERLLAGLARLGIQAKSLRGRIHLNVVESLKLSELIAPFVPPSMRYKLHPETRLRIPFRPLVASAEPPQVLYDEVEAVEVVHTGADKTFYCIDVEGTHNFVTAGGVVHNCRPPNNREPADDEAEACRAYLEQQLSLVQPKLIVALGAVAARLLLRTETPVGKLRGSLHEWGPGKTPLLVTYHPAYLLRSPGEKAKSWDDLKKVHAFLNPPPPAGGGRGRG